MKISLLVVSSLFGLASMLLPCAVFGTELAASSLEQTPAPVSTPATDLFTAAGTGDVTTLQRLLNEGIPPDSLIPRPPPDDLVKLFNPRTRAGRLLSDEGATALMVAVAAGQHDTAALLLASKANREARTQSGLRPLDIAAERDDIPAMQLVLGVDENSDAAHLSILVDLAAQRVVLSRDGVPVTTSKISSGKKEKPTPPGKYVITQKYTTWRSTLYHNAPMNYFLRLSCSPVGLHQGVLPGYPASHGCVRMPEQIAKQFFATVPRGTIVEIR